MPNGEVATDSDGRLTAAPALTVAATVKHHDSKGGPRRAGAPDSARDYAITDRERS